MIKHSRGIPYTMECHTSLQMHRRNSTHYYLSDRLDYVSDYNLRNTRNATNNVLHFPKPRVEKCRQSFQYVGPVLYNSLPSDVKESNNMS